MAVQTSNSKRRDAYEQNNDDETSEFDEEIDETEDDLIENYLYLTKRCGALKHSPTASALHSSQQRTHPNSSMFSRQFSLALDDHQHEFERTYGSFKNRPLLNDFNNNKTFDHHSESRIPPTIYYNSNEDDDDDDESFSLVKLFARMKARLKHDRRYRPRSTHELLHEEDSQEWFELTKNIRSVLTKALLPDGGYDAMIKRQTQSTNHSRHNSQKKSREQQPVLFKDFDEEIPYEIDDELNTEGDQEFDEIIWKNFQRCSRGGQYRRSGVCKAVDRQQYQGQLVYVYGVANNILIDENLRASGLG